MPTLTVNSNVTISDSNGFILRASKLVAQLTGKPESYVMVVFHSPIPVSFGGNSTEPAAYTELASIGGFSNTEKISSELSSFLQKELGVDPSRGYISFKPLKGSEFGWNGSTF